MSFHKTLFKRTLLAATLSLALPLAAQAEALQQAVPAQIPVAATELGTLLAVQAASLPAAPEHASQQLLISYRSLGARGEPVVVSGYVLVPKGEPPEGGWPVLAWAHGTTGVADICALSGVYQDGPAYNYHAAAMGALDPWLAQGYAVVATDYQGLGTPGGHPYMNADSQLHAVVDSVRAARHLLPESLSSSWLVLGHSQGGAAALAVAAGGQAYGSELQLQGAIAAAPGGYDYAGIAQYVLDNPELAPGVAAFFPIVLLGAAAADPDIRLDQLVSPAMQPLMNQAGRLCLDGLQEVITESPESVFQEDADLKPLLSYLERQSIERMSPTVPVLIIQGTSDALVDARGTSAYYQQLCKADKAAFYESITDGSHRDALLQSWPLAAGFLDYLHGNAQQTGCESANREQ